jgi:hypothetical protein
MVAARRTSRGLPARVARFMTGPRLAGLHRRSAGLYSVSATNVSTGEGTRRWGPGLERPDAARPAGAPAHAPRSRGLLAPGGYGISTRIDADRRFRESPKARRRPTALPGIIERDPEAGARSSKRPRASLVPPGILLNGVVSGRRQLALSDRGAEASTCRRGSGTASGNSGRAASRGLVIRRRLGGNGVPEAEDERARCPRPACVQPADASSGIELFGEGDMAGGRRTG